MLDERPTLDNGNVMGFPSSFTAQAPGCPLLLHHLAVALVEIDCVADGREFQVLSPSKQPVFRRSFDGLLVHLGYGASVRVERFAQNPAIHRLRWFYTE